MSERSRDWLDQAAADLKLARLARGGGSHEWACFAAQQAGEKAVKALFYFLGGDPRGHAITKLLADLEGRLEVPPAAVDSGRRLDRLYIPTRYPSGFDAGKPADYFADEDSERAIDDASRIISWVEEQVR